MVLGSYKLREIAWVKSKEVPRYCYQPMLGMEKQRGKGLGRFFGMHVHVALARSESGGQNSPAWVWAQREKVRVEGWRQREMAFLD